MVSCWSELSSGLTRVVRCWYPTGYCTREIKLRQSESIPCRPIETAAVRARPNLRASVVLSLLSACAIAPPLPGRAQLGAMPAADTSVPARVWAEDAATKEIAIILHSGSYIRYRQRTINAKGDELRDVIESKDGTVGRLIMRDNRALTAEEDQAERDRLTGLLQNPSDFGRHIKNDASGKKLAIDLIKLMPDAMIYTYAPDQTPAAASSAPQVVLDYSPNPMFRPPTTTSEALSGLRGRVWIDTRAKTIVRITGDIFQAVNFGWGMLAHIYPGGQVDVEQAAAIGDRWNMTSFHEHVTVKALMVKTIKVNTEVYSLDFQPLPGELSYQEAIHLLLDTPLPK